ncbi:MAG: response regulator [Thermodesulfobacteriota bacterium]
MKCILIADDSGMARMFIRRCLEISGCQACEFLEAENGRVALQLLKEKPVDLVVSDLNMPEMNGEELLKRIKSSPRLHEIPVLIITSAANPKKVAELTALHAAAVLNKPVSPASISEALGMLGHQREERP